MSDRKNKEKSLLDAIKLLLKDHPVVQKMFDEFDVDREHIVNMPLEFGKLDVSAKTKNGRVYLNEKLIDDGNFKDDLHYVVHEARHWLQQTNGDARKYKAQGDEEYLDLPAEVEAFKDQIAFMKRFYGEKEARTYLDKLLDFHEFEGEDRKRKYKELMGE